MVSQKYDRFLLNNKNELFVDSILGQYITL